MLPQRERPTERIQTHALICGSGPPLHMKDNARILRRAEAAGSLVGISGEQCAGGGGVCLSLSHSLPLSPIEIKT